MASFSSSRRLPSSSWTRLAIPVTLPPGRPRLLTRPPATGSAAEDMTMGSSLLARWAARTATPLRATITSTLRRTSSAASSPSRSAWPSAYRYSRMIVEPGVHPSSRRPRSKGSRWTAGDSAELPGLRIPTRGTRAGWPRACRGKAAAVARPTTTARRPIPRALLIADARVEVAVEQIDPQVDEGEGQRDHEDAALDEREVPGQDPLDHEGAHPGPREDRLGQHGAAEEVAGL